MPLIYKQSPLFHHRINVRFAQTFPTGLRRAAAQSGGKEKRVLFPLTLPKRLTPHSGVNHSKGGLCANPLSSKRATPLCGVAPSLHILHIWEYNCRLFPQQTLFIKSQPSIRDNLPRRTAPLRGAVRRGRETRPCSTHIPRTTCAA